MFIIRIIIPNSMAFIDFHLHTHYSDGMDNPAQLVQAARIKGLDMIAVTDHDHLQGYYESVPHAKKWGLQLVPGVELTTIDHHLLALGFNPDNEEFRRFVDYSREVQRGVCAQRIELLAAHGVPISFDKVASAFPRSTLGKFSIIFTMMSDQACQDYLKKQHGSVDVRLLMSNYLSENGVAGRVEKKRWISWDEAIDSVHKAEGLAFCAHPSTKTGDPEKILHLLRGVDGLEDQPAFGKQNSAFIEYAKKNGLLVTHGSDYHGSAFGAPMLMRGDCAIDDSLYGKLRHVHK
jgi:predicted metal-dependent phosphoesterase TrpH